MLIQTKTYNEKKIDTLLDYEVDALDLADKVMDYSEDIHGRFSIVVPMKYYSLEIGDRVYVEVYRTTQSMLGTKTCEILGKTYNLTESTIELKLRIM